MIGLLGIATISEALSRGVGATVTLALLVEARARRLAAAVLYSTETGSPFYRQLGFEELECGIGRYL